MTEEPLEFNKAYDCIYGGICFLCFIIGTVGNILSFLYFRFKKRDISNTIYKFITLNDTVICVAVIPVGVAFLTDRSSGPLLAMDVGCTAWLYLWVIGVRLSIFLVICLCSSRTYSLIRPFVTQKIWPLYALMFSYLILNIGQLVGFHVLSGTMIKYMQDTARCELILHETKMDDENVLIALEICMIITYVLPVFVVIISCVVSVFKILLNSRTNERRGQRAQRESRQRATVTIILFALLYGICNVPIALKLTMQTYSVHTGGEYNEFYEFDTWPYRYFHNATWTLLLAVNSAFNPVLYFWRMSALRRHTVSYIRWILFGEPMRRISNSQGNTTFNQRMMYSLESEANLAVRNNVCQSG